MARILNPALVNCQLRFHDTKAWAGESTVHYLPGIYPEFFQESEVAPCCASTFIAHRCLFHLSSSPVAVSKLAEMAFAASRALCWPCSSHWCHHCWPPRVTIDHFKWQNIHITHLLIGDPKPSLSDVSGCQGAKIDRIVLLCQNAGWCAAKRIRRYFKLQGKSKMWPHRQLSPCPPWRRLTS